MTTTTNSSDLPSEALRILEPARSLQDRVLQRLPLCDHLAGAWPTVAPTDREGLRRYDRAARGFWTGLVLEPICACLNDRPEDRHHIQEVTRRFLELLFWLWGMEVDQVIGFRDRIEQERQAHERYATWILAGKQEQRHRASGHEAAVAPALPEGAKP